MSNVAGALFAVLALAVIACSGEGAQEETTTTVRGASLSGDESLIVMGDWGAGTAAQNAVAEAMADRAEHLDVAAIITTGDNLYFDDATRLMEPYAWAIERDIPFLITWGNHDVETDRRLDVVDETFDDPPRWVLHEWGEIDVVFLDSNSVESAEQVDFLNKTLSTGTDPTIVVFHHPPYSCGSHGDTQAVIDHWLSEFDEDVFLVLNGHEHSYQRFEVEQVTYVVTGGGGRRLTPLEECSADHPDRVAEGMAHHFLTLQQSAGQISVFVVDSSGDELDRFSLPLG